MSTANERIPRFGRNPARPEPPPEALPGGGREKDAEAGQEQHVVHFGSTAQAFARLLERLPGRRFWLLMDEWSVVPLELQPLLADFIRRCLLPVAGVVVKIAAIEQRSRFRVKNQDGDYLGIELGADMSADVDFDDFMVFDNDADKAKTFFAELFFRHVRQMIRDERVENSPEDIHSSAEFQSRAFTQRNAFEELVRAAEGVPRDAIHIASLAAQRAVNEPVSVPHIRIAARKWYQRDKESAVQATPEALRLLQLDPRRSDRAAPCACLFGPTGCRPKRPASSCVVRCASIARHKTWCLWT